jgi:hypothetical protein
MQRMFFNSVETPILSTEVLTTGKACFRQIDSTIHKGDI